MVANFRKYQRKLYAENFKNNTCSHICSDYYKMFGRKRYISPKELKKIQKEIGQVINPKKEKHRKNLKRFVNSMSPTKGGAEHTDGTTSNDGFSDEEQA